MKVNSFFVAILFSLIFWTCGTKSEQTAAEPTLPMLGDPNVDAITAALREAPQNPELYYNRAGLFYELESYDNAISDLANAIQLDSTQVEYYHLLSDVYLDYFKSRLALLTLQKAVQVSEEGIPTLLKLAEVQLILTKHQESLKTIDRILRKSPQNPDAYLLMGLNFKEMGDTSRAINSFQESVDNNSQMVDAWIELGNLFAATGRSQASACFDNAIQIAPNAIEPYHAKAFYLANIKNELEAAIEVYEQLHLVDPQYEEAYYNSGLLYLDLEKYEDAYKKFDLTVKISPTHIRGYYYRGVASELQGNLAAAKTDYEQALKMVPSYEAAAAGLERINRAVVN